MHSWGLTPFRGPFRGTVGLIDSVNEHIILGLWPIAGITTVGVSEAAAEATIATALAAGITQFDTAYSYGYDGQCDRLLGKFVAGDRDRYRIIGKVGQRWLPNRTRINDGSAPSLTRDAEESLRRSGIDHFDTLMLHAPDQNVSIEESATALDALKSRGLCRRIGVCNVNVEQFLAFSMAAECSALQCPLNLMQQDNLHDLIPICWQRDCDVFAFWALMKGLLAGKNPRDHVFDPADIRPNYPIFQGKMREQTHQMLDQLQVIADEVGRTIAQLAVGWVMSQPGVTAVLVGAHRPDQIQETAKARPLEPELLERIDAARSSLAN